MHHECSPTAQPEPLVHLAKEGNLKSGRLYFQEIAFLQIKHFFGTLHTDFLLFSASEYILPKKQKFGISRHEKEKCIATVAL